MCTSIIIAGGKSLRIGENKALLKFNGFTLIDLIVNKLITKFKHIIVSTNNPEQYSFLGEKVIFVKDKYTDRGGLEGIYRGLITSKSEYNFVVSCDLPFLNMDLIGYIWEKRKNFDVVVIKRNNDEIEPFYGVYSKNCISKIKKNLEQRNLRIISFYPEVRVKYINEKEILKFDLNLSLFNLNTLDDYKKALEIFKSIVF